MVRELIPCLPSKSLQRITITPKAIALRNAYLDAGIVGARWVDDATHVATASVAGADAIVSWNFKHIVRPDKINAYNEVNQQHGYRAITILTPTDIVHAIELQEPDTDENV